MSDPYVGEVRIFTYSFAPRGWADCDGQTMSIDQQSALYAIVGTTYGGDGISTFAVPGLIGRAPMHQGTGPGLTPRNLGEAAGESSLTLLATQMPAHNHGLQLEREASDTAAPQNNFLGVANQAGAIKPIYVENPDPGTMAAMSPHSLGISGSGFPHDNMQPYLILRFCIALEGIFPSQN